MAGFKKILVPVEFAGGLDDDVASGNAASGISDTTRQAVALGAAQARQGGTLRLFHATPMIPAATTYAGPAEIPGELVGQINAQARKAALASLGRVVDDVCGDLEPELVARHGDPLSLVLDEAEQWQADLIVIATSGRSRVARFFLGSTADRVLRGSTCPVLVVPAPRDG